MSKTYSVIELDKAHHLCFRCSVLIWHAKGSKGHQESVSGRWIVSDENRDSEQIEVILRSDDLSDLRGFQGLQNAYPFEPASMGYMGTQPPKTRYLAFDPDDIIPFEKALCAFGKPAK